MPLISRVAPRNDRQIFLNNWIVAIRCIIAGKINSAFTLRQKQLTIVNNYARNQPNLATITETLQINKIERCLLSPSARNFGNAW